MKLVNPLTSLRRRRRSNPTGGQATFRASRPVATRMRLWLLTKAADTWWPETLAISLSLLCSAAIGVILQSFDNKPIPKLPNDFTLNAIVSVLATTSKSAMLFIVGSCLAQMKWVYFQQEQSLIQLQLLEDATRGPLGAFWLFFDRLMGPLAALGAIITLLALAFDPFVQLVLLYQTRTVLVPSPGSVFKQSLGVWETTSSVDLDVDFTRTLNNGLWANDFDLKPTCLSKNCTWDAVRSIGWYHRCRKVAARVSEPCNLYPNQSEYASLPSTYRYNRSCGIQVKGFENFSFTFDGVGSSRENGSQTSLSMSVPITLVNSSKRAGSRKWGFENDEWLTGTDLPPDAPLAVVFTDLNYDANGNLSVNESEVCALDLCVRDYNISVRNGIASVVQTNITYGKKLRTNISDGMAVDSQFRNTFSCRQNRSQFASLPPFSGTTSFDACSNSSVAPLVCWSPGKTEGLVFKDRSQAFSVNATNDSLETIFYDDKSLAFCKVGSSAVPLGWTDQTMRTYFNGYAHFGHKVECSSKDFPCANRSSTFDQQRAAVNEGRSKAIYESDGVARAKALTPEVLMRNFAAALTKLAFDKSWTNVTGQIEEERSFIEVRWGWLILPASLNLLSALFLILTAYQTRKHQAPLWRSSTMALLFHGLSDNISIPDHLYRVSDMDGHAETIRVRMHFSDKVNRIVLEPNNNSTSAPTSIQTPVVQAPVARSSVEQSPTIPTYSPSLTASVARSSLGSVYSQ